MNIRTIGLAAMLVAASAAMSHAHDYKAGELSIAHPWSRATPAGARVAAGYLSVTNNGTEADRLVSASGAIAGRTEIHEMGVDDKGVMTMRPLADGIEVPAGATVELKPGGYHVMFLDITAPAVEGERFGGTLTFEKAGAVEVEFAVKAMGGGHGGHDSHGGHGG